MVMLMRAAVQRLGLDLSGATVLTGAATGIHACTPVLAAMAGARWVYAYARETPFASCAEMARQTLALARVAGVENTIEILTSPPQIKAFDCQIVTNIGSLRPIDSDMVERLPPEAVVAVMSETWEYRAHDIDLAACIRHNIPVVATNERHPLIDTFPYVAGLAVQQVEAAGFAITGSNIAVVSDVPYGPHIREALINAGAEVSLGNSFTAIAASRYDAVVMATLPRDDLETDRFPAETFVGQFGSLPAIQFCGDIDRASYAAHGVPLWPHVIPLPGASRLIIPELGPEAIIRMNSGAFRAAELVYRGGVAAAAPGTEAEILRVSTRRRETSL